MEADSQNDHTPRRPAAPLRADNLHDADYRLMVDVVADYAIFFLDSTGHVLSWNLGAREINGYDADEVLGRHVSMFYPAELLAAGTPAHELEVAEVAGRFEDEGWRLRKDGTRFWASVVVTRLSGPTGELRGFSTITRDLSERRRRDELLRLSEERFRLMVEGVKDYAIFMLDPDGRIASWNAGAQLNKGYTAAESIGRHFSIFYPPEAVAKGWPDEELRRAIQAGRFEDEGWRVRKDGTRFWASVVITALYDADGRHRGFAKVTRDLTDRRRVTTLEDEGRRVATFLAMLGHELRNPLAPIAHGLAILEQESTGAAVRAQTRRVIRRQLTQLTRLVDDLLDVGRITSGKIQLESRPVRIRDVVEQAAEAVQPIIEAKMHVLTIVGADVDPWVLGDEARMLQIVSNLLNNAAKFTPANGHITVRLSCSASHADISVRDDGPGINPRDLQHVFELFAQGEQDIARSQGGLGLGLSLVQQLTTLQGGEVSAFSSGVAGDGCEFIVRMPTTSARPSVVLRGTAVRGQGRRVLVVDDNRDAADLMAQWLNTLDYVASVAYDGAAAAAIVLANPPDLVLLDIGLPELNGLEVARQITGELANPPILIAVTGYGQEADREASRDAGFDAHVTKPVNLAQLTGVMEALVGRREDADPGLVRPRP